MPPPPRLPFPYTTLFRSVRTLRQRSLDQPPRSLPHHRHHLLQRQRRQAQLGPHAIDRRRDVAPGIDEGAVEIEDNGDRKSTRLNSSHRCISYAVFGLKKK